MDSQAKYTVFVDNSIGGTSFFLSGDGLDCPDGLQECIDFASTFVGHYGERFTPVAWMDGWGRNDGTFRSDAIAAGRTITLLDGKYVPQGVEAGKPIEEKPEDDDRFTNDDDRVDVVYLGPATHQSTDSPVGVFEDYSGPDNDGSDGEVDAWFDAMEAGCSAAMGTPERLFAPLPKPEPKADRWAGFIVHKDNSPRLPEVEQHKLASLGSMSHQLGSAWKK